MRATTATKSAAAAASSFLWALAVVKTGTRFLVVIIVAGRVVVDGSFHYLSWQRQQQSYSSKRKGIHHHHHHHHYHRPTITNSKMVSLMLRGGGGGGYSSPPPNNMPLLRIQQQQQQKHGRRRRYYYSAPYSRSHSHHKLISSSLSVHGGGGGGGDDADAVAESSSSSSSIASTTNSNTNLQGIMYMTLASLSFSLMFLGVKLYSNAPTFTLVFYRSVVQAILSGILLKTEGHDPMGPPDVRGLLTLRATFGSLAVAAFYYAVQHLPLPDAITLQFTTPVFAAVMAVPLLKEPWKQSNMIGAIFCLAGVLMIARPSWLFGNAGAAAAAATTGTVGAGTVTGVGLVGAALAALAYVLVRRIGSRAEANVMVFYYAVLSALSAPVGSKLMGTGKWDVIGNPNNSELLVFVGLGVFGFLGQLFTNRGLTACDSAATATLITNTQIVFAFLFEITILHESISPWSIAGTALIVGYMAFTGIGMIVHEKKVACETKEQ